jgi:hypothetical protein
MVGTSIAKMDSTMSIERNGSDDQDAVRRRAHTPRSFDGDGGGLMARWQARLRLQQERRSGVQDRRRRQRPEADPPDRRLVG